MKKLLYVFALCGLLASCDLLDKENLDLGVGDVTISSSGGSETVNFTVPGNWTAKADKSWVRIDPEDGTLYSDEQSNEVWMTVSVDEANESGKDRTAKVTVTVGGETGSFRVIQKGSDGGDESSNGGEGQKRGDIKLADSYPFYNCRNFAGDSFEIGVVASVIAGGVRTDYNYPDYAPTGEDWPDWINVSKTFTSDWRYTTDSWSDDYKALINSHTVTLTRNTHEAERSFSFVFRGKKSDGTVLESEPITVSQSAAANGNSDQTTSMFVCSASDMWYQGSFGEEGTHNHTFDIYVYEPTATLRVESGDTSWLNASISGTGDKRTLNVAIAWPAAAGKIGDITIYAETEAKSESYTFTMNMSQMQQ